MKNTIVAVLLAVLSAFLFVGCRDTQQNNSVPVGYSLYCGLNDADTGTQIISTEKACELARKVITDKGFGYTEHVCFGAYTDENGAVENVTLIYDLFFIEKADVDKIADEIRAALNLTPILVVEGSRNYWLKQS